MLCGAVQLSAVHSGNNFCKIKTKQNINLFIQNKFKNLLGNIFIHLMDNWNILTYCMDHRPRNLTIYIDNNNKFDVLTL